LTSKRPPARRYGLTSAVTSTAAALRERTASAGTSTPKLRSTLATLCTVMPPERPPAVRSPLLSSPTAMP
jgi:hypothetical protein